MFTDHPPRIIHRRPTPQPRSAASLEATSERPPLTILRRPSPQQPESCPVRILPRPSSLPRSTPASPPLSSSVQRSYSAAPPASSPPPDAPPPDAPPPLKKRAMAGPLKVLPRPAQGEPPARSPTPPSAATRKVKMYYASDVGGMRRYSKRQGIATFLGEQTFSPQQDGTRLKSTTPILTVKVKSKERHRPPRRPESPDGPSPWEEADNAFAEAGMVVRKAFIPEGVPPGGAQVSCATVDTLHGTTFAATRDGWMHRWGCDGAYTSFFLGHRLMGLHMYCEGSVLTVLALREGMGGRVLGFHIDRHRVVPLGCIAPRAMDITTSCRQLRHGNAFLAAQWMPTADTATVTLYELIRGQGMPTAHFTGHKAAVTALEHFPDHSLMLSGAMDGVVKVWDERQHRGIATITTSGPVTSLAGWEASHLVIAGSRDGYVSVWDLRRFPKSWSLDYSTDGPGLSRQVLLDPFIAADIATLDDGAYIACMAGGITHLVPPVSDIESAVRKVTSCHTSSISPVHDNQLLAAQSGRVVLVEPCRRKATPVLPPSPSPSPPLDAVQASVPATIYVTAPRVPMASAAYRLDGEYMGRPRWISECENGDKVMFSEGSEWCCGQIVGGGRVGLRWLHSDGAGGMALPTDPLDWVACTAKEEWVEDPSVLVTTSRECWELSVALTCLESVDFKKGVLLSHTEAFEEACIKVCSAVSAMSAAVEATGTLFTFDLSGCSLTESGMAKGVRWLVNHTDSVSRDVNMVAVGGNKGPQGVLQLARSLPRTVGVFDIGYDIDLLVPVMRVFGTKKDTSSALCIRVMVRDDRAADVLLDSLIMLNEDQNPEGTMLDIRVVCEGGVSPESRKAIEAGIAEGLDDAFTGVAMSSYSVSVVFEDHREGVNGHQLFVPPLPDEGQDQDCTELHVNLRAYCTSTDEVQRAIEGLIAAGPSLCTVRLGTGGPVGGGQCRAEAMTTIWRCIVENPLLEAVEIYDNVDEVLEGLLAVDPAKSLVKRMEIWGGGVVTPCTLRSLLRFPHLTGLLHHSSADSLSLLQPVMKECEHSVKVLVLGSTVCAPPDWTPINTPPETAWREVIEQSSHSPPSSFVLPHSPPSTVWGGTLAVSTGLASSMAAEVTASEVQDLLASYGVPEGARAILKEQGVDGSAFRFVDQGILAGEFGITGSAASAVLRAQQRFLRELQVAGSSTGEGATPPASPIEPPLPHRPRRRTRR